MPEYEDIFLKGDSKRQLRSNHQKGHVNKDGVYVKHTERKKKPKQPKGDRPRRPYDQTQRLQNRFNNNKPNMNFEMGSLPLKQGSGVPKMSGMNMPTGNASYRPAPVGASSANLGGVPQTGSIRPPGLFPGTQPPFGMNTPNMAPLPPPSAFKFSGPMQPPNINPTGNLPPQSSTQPSTMPPQGMPPQGLPPQGLPSQGMPPVNMVPPQLPPGTITGPATRPPPLFGQPPINFPKPQPPANNE